MLISIGGLGAGIFILMSRFLYLTDIKPFKNDLGDSKKELEKQFEARDVDIEERDKTRKNLEDSILQSKTLYKSPIVKAWLNDLNLRSELYETYILRNPSKHHIDNGALALNDTKLDQEIILLSEFIENLCEKPNKPEKFKACISTELAKELRELAGLPVTEAQIEGREKIKSPAPVFMYPGRQVKVTINNGIKDQDIHICNELPFPIGDNVKLINTYHKDKNEAYFKVTKYLNKDCNISYDVQINETKYLSLFRGLSSRGNKFLEARILAR